MLLRIAARQLGGGIVTVCMTSPGPPMTKIQDCMETIGWVDMRPRVFVVRISKRWFGLYLEMADVRSGDFVRERKLVRGLVVLGAP